MGGQDAEKPVRSLPERSTRKAAESRGLHQRGERRVLGLAKMYEELHEKTGATLEFEDMDLAKEFGFGGAEE